MLFMQSSLFLLSSFVLCLLAGHANAQDIIWKYLKGYKIGIDQSFSKDIATIEYDVKSSQFNNDELCEPSPFNLDRMRCQSQIVADSSGGYGIFLQQAFKRKGLWHYDIDLGLSFRSMEGKFDKYDRNADSAVAVDPNQPLKKVDFYLYGLLLKPHITLGITPKRFFPDLLVSFGPTAAVYWGSTVINDNVKQESGFKGVYRRSDVLNVLSFLQFEAVLLRFGDGFISFYTGYERDVGQNKDGNIVPVGADNMTNIDVIFDRNISGTKLQFNWP